ncbi:MAG: hypothetical protein HC932_05925 [Thermales bacterium]|nr:hypothetical protein [Thermales bacterium]
MMKTSIIEGAILRYTNNEQTKTIDELIQLHLIPDMAGDRWILKQIFFIENPKNSEEFNMIILCFIDKTNLIIYKHIDANGSIRR